MANMIIPSPVIKPRIDQASYVTSSARTLHCTRHPALFPRTNIPTL